MFARTLKVAAAVLVISPLFAQAGEVEVRYWEYADEMLQPFPVVPVVAAEAVEIADACIDASATPTGELLASRLEPSAQSFLTASR
jgi:hypothetical protein